MILKPAPRWLRVLRTIRKLRHALRGEASMRRQAEHDRDHYASEANGFRHRLEGVIRFTATIDYRGGDLIVLYRINREVLRDLIENGKLEAVMQEYHQQAGDALRKGLK